MYRKRAEKSYLPRDKWIARAFRRTRPVRQKRFMVQYQAIVDGQSVIDAVYVLANTPKEALLKARNLAKSYHPKAKGIMVAIREEHTFKPR